MACGSCKGTKGRRTYQVASHDLNLGNMEDNAQLCVSQTIRGRVGDSLGRHLDVDVGLKVGNW